MNLVFLGPPGAGKGTQAGTLAARVGTPHVSTGDILRRAIALGTPTGLEAQRFVDAGDLVPAEIILRLVRDRLGEDDAAHGWILDGFPRTLDQAHSFDEMLADLGTTLDRVVYFRVPDDVVVERLSGRRTCRNCGSTAHVRFSPPSQEGICDACEGELYQRPDDEESAIRNRLQVYDRETDPLVGHYAERGLLLEIDGGCEVERVRAAVAEALGIGS